VEIEESEGLEQDPPRKRGSVGRETGGPTEGGYPKGGAIFSDHESKRATRAGISGGEKKKKPERPAP